MSSSLNMCKQPTHYDICKHNACSVSKCSVLAPDSCSPPPFSSHPIRHRLSRSTGSASGQQQSHHACSQPTWIHLLISKAV